jgi:hypothetical protein
MSHQQSSSAMANPNGQNNNLSKVEKVAAAQLQLLPEPQITILNIPFTHLRNHPVNVTIRQLN